MTLAGIQSDPKRFERGLEGIMLGLLIALLFTFVRQMLYPASLKCAPRMLPRAPSFHCDQASFGGRIVD